MIARLRIEGRSGEAGEKGAGRKRSIEAGREREREREGGRDCVCDRCWITDAWARAEVSLQRGL